MCSWLVIATQRRGESVDLGAPLGRVAQFSTDARLNYLYRELDAYMLWPPLAYTSNVASTISPSSHGALGSAGAAAAAPPRKMGRRELRALLAEVSAAMGPRPPRAARRADAAEPTRVYKRDELLSLPLVVTRLDTWQLLDGTDRGSGGVRAGVCAGVRVGRRARRV